MKDELKTLKDLDYKGIETIGQDHLVSVKDLRQEAIKWVKQILIDNSYRLSGSTPAWIIDFFNITEEELK